MWPFHGIKFETKFSVKFRLFFSYFLHSIIIHSQISGARFKSRHGHLLSWFRASWVPSGECRDSTLVRPRPVVPLKSFAILHSIVTLPFDFVRPAYWEHCNPQTKYVRINGQQNPTGSDIAWIFGLSIYLWQHLLLQFRQSPTMDVQVLGISAKHTESISDL
jgi:hypothetical protein